MLHFFSGIERSEEEKGDGAFCVFAEIRQIYQFAPAPTPRRTAPGLSGLSGRGRSPFRLTHKKKPPRNVPQRPRQRALPFRKELTCCRFNAIACKRKTAPMRRRAQGFALALLFFPRPALWLCFFFVRSGRVEFSESGKRLV